jgi:hypothetical protein
MIKATDDNRTESKQAKAKKTGEESSKSHEATNLKPIMSFVLEKLRQNPGGLHYTEIVELITSENKCFPVSLIDKALAKLVESDPGLVEKPSRGLYRYRGDDGEAPSIKPDDSAHGIVNAHYDLTSLRPRVLVREGIVATALEVLREHREELSYTSLVNEVHQKAVGASYVTIARTVSRLPQLVPENVEKPRLGFYRYRGTPIETVKVRASAEVCKSSGSERNFYQSFADWLMHDTEECTKAVPLGGKAFGIKWGTPDVIGILQKKRTDPVEFPPEIVSAEVKSDSHELVTAFGQACAYKLFSHKSYLVVPKAAPQRTLTDWILFAKSSESGLCSSIALIRSNPVSKYECVRPSTRLTCTI